jgi:hypothetical protein
MANVSQTVLAKSDQLNFDDFSGNKKVILITDVKVKIGDQPVSVFYDGHNGKPWKPSLGMRRLLIEAYGEESDNWIGKSVELYGDATVRWAGAEIGGIRISALSDIEPKGMTAFIAISRGKRRKAAIPLLIVEPQKATEPTQDDLNWVVAIKADPNVLEQITDNKYKTYIQSLIKG